MLAGFLLALREGIEAALIVGIVLGMLKKMNRSDRAPWVWLGVSVATVVSVIAAVALNVLGARFEGPGEKIFEGFTMLFAAGVLTWMIFWMQKQGRQTQLGLEADVRSALSRGTHWGLFFVAFLAVVREGIELALFLTAVNFSEPAAGVEAPILGWLGGLLGLIAAVIIGWLIFDTTIKLNLRRFFQLTSIVLIVFAAGLMGHAIHEFNELGWIPSVVEHVYDINAFMPEASTAGQFLKALFGYNADPSLTEMLGYLGYFVVVFGLTRWLARKPVATAKVTATTVG
ncbi:MAG: FTR1 family protein [Chloroflexi bacterium]|nr:FTR1 family protein [Chloroflexota bacterium]